MQNKSKKHQEGKVSVHVSSDHGLKKSVQSKSLV